ncbi:MAG: hypothetical protein JXQ73_11515 [Phycisphaerae bacterium]|nr:hypothetical protein [Phycisphaerae bacterium]
MDRELTRRDFVHNSVIASAGAALALGADGAKQTALGAEAPPKPATGAIPKGKIGDLQISRLVLGGNLIGRYNHIRDLSYVQQLVNRYNTDAKILETIALAEAMGIDTITANLTSPLIRKLLKEHREKRGGKMQWIAHSVVPFEQTTRFAADTQRMVDDGADALYLWGEPCDKLVREGKIKELAALVEILKSHGLPCAVGAHELPTIQACEKHKIPCDFYIKTLHHMNYPSAKMDFDSIFCRQAQETIDFMKGVEKPWMAFKVMAGGAIPPRDGFKYAIENGADFILAGMFDFEVAPDVRIINEVLAATPKRNRPWRA